MSERTQIMKHPIFRYLTLILLFTLALGLPCEARQPRDGIQKEYYGNGALRMKTKYKDGRIVYKNIYFQNGQLSKQYVYRGRKRIKSKTYYDSGQLQSEWTEKSGEAKYYSRQGRLKAVVRDDPGKALKEKIRSSGF